MAAGPIELTMQDRLILMNVVIPRVTGTIATLRILNDMKNALAPTEEEHKELGIVEDPTKNTILWLREKDFPKEIPIGEKARQILVDTVEKMRDLPMECLATVEKFMPQPAA